MDIRWSCDARIAAMLLGLPMACNPGPGSDSGQSSSLSGSSASQTGSGSDSGPTSSVGDASDGPTTMSSADDESGAKFDVFMETEGAVTTGPEPTCHVVDDMNAVPECDQSAPPDSFSPVVEWSWDGFEDDDQAITAVLVANLTDDDGNGQIDLCDTPDLVVAAFASYPGTVGRLYALDGATGSMHWVSEVNIDASSNPALGDLDGDGLPEIVAGASQGGPLVAFNHDGSVAWNSTGAWTDNVYGALAIADLDADGSPEILGGRHVWAADGTYLHANGAFAFIHSATTAADIDDDGQLEVILGDEAYEADGTLHWSSPVGDGFPQVGNLDGDPEPEILVTNDQGLHVLEHDGQVKYTGLRPTGDSGINVWRRPATIHDFDGDGQAEYAVSSANHYTVFESDATIVWSSDVLDGSGIAAGTAFDFLGLGSAQAMYADETTLFVFDDLGGALLEVDRSSGTLIEYPVVADVDNDGSAEIIVVSNSSFTGIQTAPAVQVIADADDRWIQARRIWNQHTYHVTNVREDGTIPAVEPKHWTLLNTFRTNAQIEAGGICNPEPEG